VSAFTAALLTGFACVSAAAAPAEATAWREDLRVMAREMELIHKHLFHTVTCDEFAAAVDGLSARIEVLARHQIIVEFARIAAAIGDGHTNLSLHRDPKVAFRALPVRLYLFDDGLHVRAARPDLEPLLGARIDAIGEVGIVEAIQRVGAIISRDNDVGLTALVPVYLAMPEVLHALGLSSSPDGAEFTLSRDGRSWRQRLEADGPAPLYPSDTDVSLEAVDGWIDAATDRASTVWLQAPRAEHRLVSIEPRQTLYLQLNKVGDAADLSLAQLADEISRRVRLDNPARIVLDLRHNRGGAGHLRYPVVKALIRAEDADTRLFVLIGRNTFSAAQFITDDLDVYSDAVLVGEPTGSKPNAYGDSRKIVLPNSGLTVRASTYWWQENQDRTRQWTGPDVATDYTFADYAAGRDPALQAALAYRASPAPEDLLKQAAADGGADAVERAAAAFRADPANRYRSLARPLVGVGHRLFTEQRNEDALAVLALATRTYPQSAFAHSMLAHVLYRTGDSDGAGEAAERALELNPNDQEALAVRRQLAEQAPPPQGR
jgi:hypothetical protein